jgi:cyanate lyase
MSWLNTVLLVLQVIDKVVAWLRERQLMDAGEAKAVAEALELSNVRIKAAQDARRRADNSDPDPDDPYLRD